MNTQNVQASQNESNSLEQKGEGEKHPTPNNLIENCSEIVENLDTGKAMSEDFIEIKPETNENLESVFPDSKKFLEIRPETINEIEINKYMDKSESNTDEKCGALKRAPQEFLEIKPETISKNEIDKNKGIYKLSFKLTNDEYVEIIYNNKLNTFNASKLVKSLGDKTTEQLKNWLRYDEINKFIDYVSHHLFINQNPILYTNEQEFKQSRIIYKYDNNKYTTIEKGTWLNFELLPEILRFSSNKYRFLANHYENMLLIHLSNKSISFEQEVKAKEYQTLITNQLIEKLNKIPEPFKKGSEAEKAVAQLLSEVFDPEDINIISNHPHNCDIQIEKDKILVEVKAVKNDSSKNDLKFVKDLITHHDSINCGIYVNLLDPKIKTHVEINPLRFYLNPDDFNIVMLKIIKQTCKVINRKLIDNAESLEQYKQLLINRQVLEEFINHEAIFHKKLLKRIEARMKLILMKEKDPLAEILTFNDIDHIEKKEESLEQEKSIETAIDEFITKNYNKFKENYPTKQAKIDIINYLNEQHITIPKWTEIQTILNTRVDKKRDNTEEGKPHVYMFYEGMEDKFKPTEEQSLIINEQPINETKQNFSTITGDELIKEFISIPKYNEKLNSDKGFKAEDIAAAFRETMKRDFAKKYNIQNVLIYTSKFQQLILKYCIQFKRNSKNFYIFKESTFAQDLLNDFNEIFNNIYSKNEHINYNEFEKLYNDRKGNMIKLTRPIILPLFNEYKDEK